MQDRENKNAVFGQPQGVSLQKRVEEEFGVVIPEISVPLPSNGAIYPEGSPLHQKTEVVIRAMTTKEEDIMTSRALIQQGTVLTYVLKSCLVDKKIDVQALLSGDRNALMTAIRITGYGSEYKVKDIECPNCSEKFEYTFDLSGLPINRLMLKPVEVGQNLFDFDLPISKKRVQFRFLTGRDEEEITFANKKKKKMEFEIQNLVSTRLQHCLVSVAGNTDRAAISRFVQALPAGDSRALRNYIEKHEPGISMKNDVVCKYCQEESEVGVPLTASFFFGSDDV